MKLSACTSAWVLSLTLVLGGSGTDAWSVDASEVAPPVDIVGEHQPLQRTWTISSAAQLEQLYLAIPGRVFVELDASLLSPPPTPDPTEPTGVVVPTEIPTEAPAEAPETTAPVPVVAGRSLASSVDGSLVNDSPLASEVTIEVPSMKLRKHHHHLDDDCDCDCGDDGDDCDCGKKEERVVAKVVVTGNSTALLSMIEAEALNAKHEDGLKLHLKNADAYGEGYMLTQIYVMEKHLLCTVTTAMWGDVVLNEGVMVLDDATTQMEISSFGDGNVFLESSQDVSLASLSVVVKGSGTAQVAFPRVSLKHELGLEVVGSGAVALLSDSLTSSKVSTTVTGAGDVFFQSGNLSADSLTSSVYGSGAASFSTGGTMDKETLTLSGSGQLLAGSIVARKATADVRGHGKMLVQVTDKLTVSTSVWGKVGYVQAPPEHIKIKGWWWFWRKTSSIVHPAAENTVLLYEAAPKPNKYPIYFAVVTSHSSHWDDPDYAFVTLEPYSSAVGLMSKSISSVHEAASGPNALWYVLGGAGLVVVNVVAARSWAQRRVRRHYTSLL